MDSINKAFLSPQIFSLNELEQLRRYGTKRKKLFN